MKKIIKEIYFSGELPLGNHELVLQRLKKEEQFERSCVLAFVTFFVFGMTGLHFSTIKKYLKRKIGFCEEEEERTVIPLPRMNLSEESAGFKKYKEVCSEPRFDKIKRDFCAGKSSIFRVKSLLIRDFN